jgi:DNA-binding transcriptional LysR family regulator
MREELHHEPFTFVRSGDTQGAPIDRIPFAEAIRLPLILPPSPHPLRTNVERLAKQYGVALSVAIELHSLAGRIELVERDYGCSFLPHIDVAERIARGRLQGLAVHSPTLTRITSLVYAIRKNYSPLHIRAREILREVYASWTTESVPEARRQGGQ